MCLVMPNKSSGLINVSRYGYIPNRGINVIQFYGQSLEFTTRLELSLMYFFGGCKCSVVKLDGYCIELRTYPYSFQIYMSRVMRKPTVCICENKDADQLRGNREADQRLCFRYTDSTIPLLSKSEI